MNRIYLNSVVTQETINEIKFLSLYYDKISIINDAVYTIDINYQTKQPYVKTISFLPENFEEEYKYLIDSKILEIVSRNEDEPDKNFDSKYAKSISDFINDKQYYIFPKVGDKIAISDEIRNIVLYTFNKQDKIPMDFIWWFYAFKLKWSIKLLMEGQKCLNSSANLQYLFNEYISLNTSLSHSFNSIDLVKNAISMSLPSVDMLSFEDILELKLKLSDELKQFTDIVNAIEVKYKTLNISEYSQPEYEIIFKQEIKKPYDDLQQKIKSLRGKTFLSFINKAKDINTYIPMIGSLVASIPLKYALMLSFGLISFETYQEYKLNMNEISNNGLNYLIKLNNHK